MRRASKRLQSAMEYLMTYGWAILAIAIVMVSLYSLGIFNSGSLQPTATPGSCQVIRTVAQTSLAGQCSSLIPKYVAQFSIQNSHITMSRQLSLGNKISITAWVNYANESTLCVSGSSFNAQPVIGNLNSVWGGQGFILNACRAGAHSFCVYNCTSAVVDYSNFPKGKYEQIGATYNGDNGTISLYLNGAPVATSNHPSSQSITGGQYPMIGWNGGAGFGYFHGSISNVQVYNVSLDPASITALYQEGIGGAPIDLQHLIAWWPLNGNANDYSSYNNKGTLASVSWNANWQSGYTAPSS